MVEGVVDSEILPRFTGGVEVVTALLLSAQGWRDRVEFIKFAIGSGGWPAVRVKTSPTVDVATKWSVPLDDVGAVGYEQSCIVDVRSRNTVA
ncbi:hypothetical protein HRbin20_01420 [bacterium HR20]|nr:hypothetical protein HRbin20_01420 [bacterium HR20]